MDNLLACEARYRDHFRTVAEADRERLPEPARVPRQYRVVIANALITLATRIMSSPPRVSYQPET